MDYKNTLNLPQTGFPMKADLVTREPQRLEKWQTSGLYEKIQAQRAGSPKFVLHDGPPFANGDVHLGTALNKILKDIIVKYKSLRGFSSPYIPGWDCHGLPIEFKVTQDMRKAGDTTSDVATIRNACEAYARKYIDIQRTQFKRLGVLGDWDNPYLTLNKEYEADELRLFADIVEKGFVYRGKKPVYWSIPARTALAEAEVEYHDHVSQSIYVKFPVIGQPKTFVLIWTTTPWTLPANLAVAYNSTFQYVQVRVGEESYILFRGLLPTVAEKCGWQDFEERPFPGEQLGQLQYTHPFCNRTGRLFVGDSFVTSDTGTGFVHIAPGHGLDDYNLGRQQGLPIYSPVDDNGCFAYTNDLPRELQMPAEMVGKSILDKHGKSDANEAVLHELRLRHALLHQENYHHSYPFCWRSKTPIVFRAMDQWFIAIDHKGFRQQILDAINGVSWVPDWGKNRIEGAVKSRPDWCISRQRTWGVPIPAFYDAQGNAILDAQIVRNAAGLFEKYGSNVWFEKSVAELWSLVRPKDWKGAEPAAKSNDTLDVWIDSGSSSRAVIARLPQIRGKDKPFQADMYLEGSDQHRGWFQSSLVLSLAASNAPPFKTVLTHGFVLNDQGEKESKSRGARSIMEWVNDFGAEVVRLWVASQDYRSDVTLSEKRMTQAGETYRGIRNTLRYQLSNLYDFDPAKDTVADDKLTSLDRWILSEFAKLEKEVTEAYDRYEFHTVYQKLSQFVTVELSSIYHDVVKDRLYTDAANSHRRRATQTALYCLVTGLCRMLSPVLVFTTDEAWEFIPGKSKESVHLADWSGLSISRPEREEEVWRQLFELRARVLPELERARQAKTIGKALDAKVTLSGLPQSLTQIVNEGKSLVELLNVSQLEVKFEAGSESTITSIVGDKPDAKATLASVPNLDIQVAHADGQKCERCWHWETDIGTNPEHPTICGRCVAAVKANLASD